MLIGFAHNLGPAIRRKFIAEGRLEIAQRHATARSVKSGGELPSTGPDDDMHCATGAE